MFFICYIKKEQRINSILENNYIFNSFKNNTIFIPYKLYKTFINYRIDKNLVLSFSASCTLLQISYLQLSCFYSAVLEVPQNQIISDNCIRTSIIKYRPS